MQNNSLRENPDIRQKIELQIRESYGLESEVIAPEVKKVEQDELDLKD